MDLQDQINEDFKQAMKEQDEERLSVLKMLRSELRNEEIEQGGDLEEGDVIQLLSREAKQRRDSIEQYEDGGRDDLAEKERQELALIESYLPEPLSNEELEDVVEEVIDEVGAEDMSDMGSVMGPLMSRIRGRADGDLANKLVRERLQ